MIRGCRGGCSVEVKTFASVCMLPEFDARYLAFSVIIAKCFKALNAIYLKTLSAKKGLNPLAVKRLADKVPIYES